jgi:hypothetical protein
MSVLVPAGGSDAACYLSYIKPQDDESRTTKLEMSCVTSGIIEE